MAYKPIYNQHNQYSFYVFPFSYIYIYECTVRLRKLWRAAAYLIQWHMLQRRPLKVTRLLVEKTENDEDEIYILLWTQGKLVELTVLLLAARKISV
jgi:hypothetical protein